MAIPSRTIPHDPRDQLAAIVDCSSEAVYAADVDGRILVWNRSAEKLYGYTRQEAIGRVVTDLVPDDRRADHDEIVERVLTGERVEHYETEQLAGDGTRLEVALNVSAIGDPGGGPWGISTFARDIGQRRAIERELASTRVVLERHAQELERSNSDLEQFAYVASHDLSEPLRAISGMLDLLVEEYGDDLEGDARDYVDRSVRAALRLRRLIDDLLAYSRIGRAELVLEQVDCQELAEDVIAEVTASRHGGAPVVRAAGLPTVSADHGQLQRLLENLVSNALKFNDSPQPEVVVSAERQPTAWAFHVDDNGIGVAPEQASRIFEVFKRLHTRDAYEGTGIGLAVCRRIVERHGGTIAAAPRPDAGTRFTFTIPHPEGIT